MSREVRIDARRGGKVRWTEIAIEALRHGHNPVMFFGCEESAEAARVKIRAAGFDPSDVVRVL